MNDTKANTIILIALAVLAIAAVVNYCRAAEPKQRKEFTAQVVLTSTTTKQPQ